MGEHVGSHVHFAYMHSIKQGFDASFCIFEAGAITINLAYLHLILPGTSLGTSPDTAFRITFCLPFLTRAVS